MRKLREREVKVSCKVTQLIDGGRNYGTQDFGFLNPGLFSVYLVFTQGDRVPAHISSTKQICFPVKI